MQKATPVEQRDGDEKGKLFVGGLSWESTHASLLKYFSAYGEVIDCVVMKNQTTGKSRGFGFVKFRDPNCVDIVLASGPHLLDGRQVDPKSCNPRSLNKGPKTPEMKNKHKVFLGGLPANVTETIIREAFEAFGKVNDVVIMFDQQKQRSRGFGFLSFETEESVDRVCQQQYVQVAGKKVECKKAEPRDLKMLEHRIMLGQMPGLTFMNASGQLISASSMGMAGMAGMALSGAGLAGSAPIPTAYQPTLMPQSPSGLTLLPAAAPLTLPLALSGGLGNHMAGAMCGGFDMGGGMGWTGDTEACMLQQAALPFHAQQPQQQSFTMVPPVQPGIDSSGSSPAALGSGAALAGYPSQGYLQSPTGCTTPTSQGSSESSEKAGYLLYGSQAAALAGMLGNYPQEASSYGPARGYVQESMSTAATPTSISNTATALAQLHAAGGYGAISNGYGQTLVPLAYGGQGEQMAYATSPFCNPRMAAAAQAFHPYRR